MAYIRNRKRVNKEKRLIKLMCGILVSLVCIVITVILVNVLKNGKSENSDSPVVENEEEYNWVYEGVAGTYDIPTSYGNLVFPDKWKDYVETKIVKKNDCETVEFWFRSSNKEKVHVFDILFGGDGYFVGVIKLSDSEEIYVHVESYGYELNDKWSNEDKAILSGIENDINFLLENLSSLENFVAM